MCVLPVYMCVGIHVHTDAHVVSRTKTDIKHLPLFLLFCGIASLIEPRVC